MYHRNEWFFELSRTALSESEFESLLIQNAVLLRPHSTIVPFKKTVYNGESSARADLAIVANDYRSWTVVEAELLEHDLYRHVIPQIRTLQGAKYGIEYAEYLARQNPNFDEKKLIDMLRGDPPHVLTLVDKPDEEWRREVSRYGAYMMVFEIFRSDSNRHIFVIDGDAPRVAADVLTELTFGPLPRCLYVSSPAALNFETGTQIPIFINGEITMWERFHTASRVYLSPVGVMPIKQGVKYALSKTENGHLQIHPLGLSGRTS
jgi:hypothetical protein